MQASGGAGAPAELYDPSKVKAALKAAGYLVPEEQELADAITEIVTKHGKFNDDNSGVWVGYTPASENEENAKIGVKCGNCVFFNAPNGCSIIEVPVEDGGLCRLAILPDGAVTATAGSKPAPKKDQVKGSDKNAKGSASGSKKINFSKSVEASLKAKAEEHNEKSDRKATLGMLKAVYRRGAGAFSTSHRPDQNRNSWAMARVNAFLYLLKSGKPRNPAYTTDYDLLPASHPKSTKSSNSITASAVESYDDVLTVTLKEPEEYETLEHCLLALSEYSGLGYEVLPALRTAWLRGVEAGENPYERASVLASALYDSADADLLPKEGTL